MINRKIVEYLIQRKQSVSLAESCTGGLISSLLTDIPRASCCFKGSVIVYTAAAKSSLLSLSKPFIREYGEVSLYTTYHLACQIRQRLDSDYALAVTGYLGPSGGTRTHPKGTICIVGISNIRTVCKTLLLTSPSRLVNKRTAAVSALKLLAYLIDKDKP